MTDIQPATSAGTTLFLSQYTKPVADFFTLQPSDVGQPTSWNSADVYQPAFAPAPESKPLQGGLWNRLRRFLGFAPTQPTATAPDHGIFSRIRRFFGAAPSATSVPLTATQPLALVDRPVGSTTSLTPAHLKALGQRSDKRAFFQALLPAAVAAEKRYGVPASVTLAQAAVESGWAKSPIGGYNIFGIKGSGSAGSKGVWTHEVFHGVRVPWFDKFALYQTFDDAIMAHGKLFHNGYYDKGIQQFAKDHDPYAFVDNVGKRYATSPTYARTIKQMMTDNDLVAMAKAAGGT